MNAEILHIFFIPQQDEQAFIRANRKLQHQNHLVVVTHESQLPTLFFTLPQDQKAVLWVHIGTFRQDAAGYPINLNYAESLKSKGIISERAVVNFFSTGGIDTNIKGDMDCTKNPYLKMVHGYPVYDLRVVGRRPEINQYQPKFQTIREIISDAHRAVEHFSLNQTPINDALRFRIESQLSDLELREILGTCFPENASDFFLTPMEGAYREGFVFRVDYCLAQQARTVVLKIDRNKESLLQEYQFGKLKSLTNLSHCFIHPYPRSLRMVNQWNCLVFPHVSNTNTLAKYLGDRLHEEAFSLHPIIEQVMERFSEFERQINQTVYQKLQPWSGTQTDSYQYRGLKLQDYQKSNFFHSLFKISSLIPSDIWEKLKIDRSNINALTNFVKAQDNCHFKNQAIDVLNGSAFQTVPLAITHSNLDFKSILINNQRKVSFTNFANVSTAIEKHAFSDMAQLSADLEISIVDFKLNDWDYLTALLEGHRGWLQHKVSNSAESRVKKIYQAQSQIKINLLVKNNRNMQEEEILHQFYLLRLHYFLKAISDQQCSREKLLFLLGLSIDTLNFLIQRK